MEDQSRVAVEVRECDGKAVAVFHIHGVAYAIAERCPHRGGPLSRGRIEFPSLQGGESHGEGESTPAVRCPLHGWLFDLATGRCLNQPGACTQVYSVMDEGEALRFEPVS